MRAERILCTQSTQNRLLPLLRKHLTVYRRREMVWKREKRGQKERVRIFAYFAYVSCDQPLQKSTRLCGWCGQVTSGSGFTPSGKTTSSRYI
jgi:hypothetical protein